MDTGVVWRGAGSPAGWVSRSRAATRLAQPNVAIASLHRWERSDVREEQHCSHGGWEGRLLDVTCSRKQKLSQNGGLPQVSPALGFMSYVWRELALFSTMTGLSFRSGSQAAVWKLRALFWDKQEENILFSSR